MRGWPATTWGVCCAGWSATRCSAGRCSAKPGSINPHTTFQAEVYVLGKEEGGRHTPFFPGYRPQFYIRTTDVTGAITLPENTEMVMPGRQRADGGGADHPGGHRGRAALRHPRGRAHRRRRGGDLDYGVGKEWYHRRSASAMRASNDARLEPT